jgi:anti-anti-sigma factor
MQMSFPPMLEAGTGDLDRTRLMRRNVAAALRCSDLTNSVPAKGMTMPEDPRQVWGPCPERWADRLAIVVLPEHFGLPNVDQIREQLLSVLNRGALVLIADLSATVSCDHAGSDALARVYQRAVSSGTEMRLVVTSEIVRRVLTVSGVDRLVSHYPSLESALAASAVPVSARTVGTAKDGRTGGPYAPGLPHGVPGERPDRSGADPDVGVEVALLDRDGVIVSVNPAWQAFAQANGGNPERTGPGVSYLDACASAPGDPAAEQVAAAIRRALDGHLPGPLTIGVPCHSPRTARWFDMLISARQDDAGQHLGATVSLSLAKSESWATLAEAGSVSPAAIAAAARGADLMRVMTHRLLGVGLLLQTAEGLAEGPLARRLSQAVAEVDAIIRDTRTAAFESGTFPARTGGPNR